MLLGLILILVLSVSSSFIHMAEKIKEMTVDVPFSPCNLEIMIAIPLSCTERPK